MGELLGPKFFLKAKNAMFDTDFAVSCVFEFLCGKAERSILMSSAMCTDAMKNKDGTRQTAHSSENQGAK
jgi:hypothetical protein